MELSFNVAWGPISQIAIPLVDINGAVQLAVGAYGWWKAQERSMSLMETIKTVGHLVPSTTFNRFRYEAARRTTEVRGIAWYDGRLESFPLPSASTANVGDGGLVCLRAITTVLLALYDANSTTAVLAEIIPQCLINYNLEDDRLVVDGPVLSGLRQFVDAVSIEEQANTLRKSLWSRVDEAFGKMLLSAKRFNVENVKEIEVPIVIGLLEWILTNPSTRATRNYPTRSMTAWSLSVMLSHLGFDVRSSSRALKSGKSYDRNMSSDSPSIGTVFLVTFQCSTRSTDPSAPTPGRAEIKRPLSTPRVMPIKAIPTIIFRSIGHLDINITLDQLCEIWDRSFEYVTSSLPPVRVTKLGLVSLLPFKRGKSTPPFADLLDLLAPQLKSYLPNYEWTPATLQETLRHLYSADTDASHLEKREWLAFTTIIFATLYGAGCKSVKIPSDQQQHSSWTSVIEVAVDPDTLSFGNPTNRLKFNRWISVLHEAIEDRSQWMPLKSSHRPDGASIHEWTAFHYELFCGVSIPPSTRKSKDFQENVLGFSKHGISVIRDIAFNPSVRPESLVEFHVQQGQPVGIPVDERGFIAGYCDTVVDDIDDDDVDDDHRDEMDEIEATPNLHVEESDLVPFESAELSKLCAEGSDRKIKIDLEPCWYCDPRRVIFRVRIDGILKCSIYPRRLCLAIIHSFNDQNRLGGRQSILSSIPCRCEQGKSDIAPAISPAKPWRVIKMSQVVDKVTFRMDSDVDKWKEMDDKTHIALLARGDVGSQVLFAVCFPGCRLYSSCTVCAVAAVKRELKFHQSRTYCVMF